MEDIESKIKQIIFDKFKLEVLNSTNISDFVEDSISKVEMLFEIEQLFETKFDEEDLLSIETVGDLIKVAKKSFEKK
jgi:acyl carrier protein